MSRKSICLCDTIPTKVPNHTFLPLHGTLTSTVQISLTLEEFESFRLRHLDNLNQKTAALKMAITSSTYQRLLYAASTKIAKALAEGKGLHITKYIHSK